MEILISLLYRNWNVNFFTDLIHFTLPPELTLTLSWHARLFPLHVTVFCCKPRARLRQRPRETRRVFFVRQKCRNGRCDLGSLSSVVAVFSGRTAIVLKFGNLQFLYFCVLVLATVRNFFFVSYVDFCAGLKMFFHETSFLTQ